MLTSTAVQIMLLFGVIIASGLLLTLTNDLVTDWAQVRSSAAHRTVHGTRFKTPARRAVAGHVRTSPINKTYATVKAIRVPRTQLVTQDNSDFKVITVRMRDSSEAEFSKAA